MPVGVANANRRLKPPAILSLEHLDLSLWCGILRRILVLDSADSVRIRCKVELRPEQAADCCRVYRETAAVLRTKPSDLNT